MSSVSASRTRRGVALAQLPDVILRDDPRGELGEPRRVVAEVEAKITQKPGEPGSRARAHELHKEADELYYKGDYESALILYHRAARLCPRDTMHAVAARRAEAAISTAAKPRRDISRLLREARTPAQVTAALCPEAAARRARAIVAESEDPVNEIPRILKYFDSRKDFLRLSSPDGTPRATRSRLMQRQLKHCVSSTFRDLESAYDSGDATAVHKLSVELVNLVTLGEQPEDTRADAFAYLAAKQSELGRHDRAIDLASKMFFHARTAGDVVPVVKALVVIGRVHLKFGHLHALVSVWERLISDVEESAEAQAWLYHDIGRCHLELGEWSLGLTAARRCLRRSQEVRSTKWEVRGHLLSGQCLLRLGRFAEAGASLRVAASAAERGGEAEAPLMATIHNLIEQMVALLKRLNQEKQRWAASAVSLPSTRDVDKLAEERKLDDARDGSTEEDEEDPEGAAVPRDCEVGRLLERTRSLGRGTSALGADDDEPAPDTSRTRIIRRATLRPGNWGNDADDEDEENILRPDELLPLDPAGTESDVDFASARIEDNDEDEDEDGDDEAVRSGVNSTARPTGAAAAATHAPDDELASSSIASSMESETESARPKTTEPGGQSGGLSDYLRNLGPPDFDEFLKQESQFFESRASSDQSS